MSALSLVNLIQPYPRRVCKTAKRDNVYQTLLPLDYFTRLTVPIQVTIDIQRVSKKGVKVRKLQGQRFTKSMVMSDSELSGCYTPLVITEIGDYCPMYQYL